jgi:hypothetical protein
VCLPSTMAPPVRMERNTISYLAMTLSVRGKGSEWQLALGLPSTVAPRVKMERDTISYRMRPLSVPVQGSAGQLALGQPSTVVTAARVERDTARYAMLLPCQPAKARRLDAAGHGDAVPPAAMARGTVWTPAVGQPSIMARTAMRR